MNNATITLRRAASSGVCCPVPRRHGLIYPPSWCSARSWNSRDFSHGCVTWSRALRSPRQTEQDYKAHTRGQKAQQSIWPPNDRHFASATNASKHQVLRNSKRIRGSKQVQRVAPGELVHVFGRLIDVNHGNDILRAIQAQRVNGTLDQDLEIPGLTPDLQDRGLAWLRKQYFVDEDAAIRARVASEVDEMEVQALSEIEEAKKWQPQQSARKGGVYGNSKVEEAVRKYNEYRENVARARQEYLELRSKNTEVIFEEEHEKVGQEIQRKITEVHLVKVGGTEIRRVKNTSYAPLKQDVRDQVEELAQQSSESGLVKAQGVNNAIRRKSDRSKAHEKWWHKYEKQAQLTNWDGVSEPPFMPLWKRWGMPTLFMLTTVGASALFAQYYKAPPMDARLFPNVPPAASTVLGLVVINLVAWFLWKIPPMWRLMNKHMMMHAVIPRPSQLLGNTFSHQKLSHLAVNMVLLWFMGTSLCDQIGRGNFLALYIGGGVFASWVSLSHLVLRKHFLNATLGASGSTFAVFSCYLWLNAGQAMEFIFFPGEWKPRFQSEHLLAFVALLELIRAISTSRTKSSQFDHFAHLGGIVAGVATAQTLRKRLQARRQSGLRR